MTSLSKLHESDIWQERNNNLKQKNNSILKGKYKTCSMCDSKNVHCHFGCSDNNSCGVDLFPLPSLWKQGVKIMRLLAYFKENVRCQSAHVPLRAVCTYCHGRKQHHRKEVCQLRNSCGEWLLNVLGKLVHFVWCERILFGRIHER